MIFTENDTAQYKRWMSDIDQMQYLISKVKFSLDKDRANGHLEELRGKCERLEKEIREFFSASKLQDNPEGQSER